MESGLGFIKSSKVLLLLFGAFGVLMIASLSVSIVNSNRISDEVSSASDSRKEIKTRLDVVEQVLEIGEGDGDGEGGGGEGDGDGDGETFDICETDVCKSSAKSILSKIKEDADPCNDFYEFTCGKYIEDNEIPEGQLEMSTFDDLNDDIMKITKEVLTGNNNDAPNVVKNARKYFKSCTDMSSIDKEGIKEYKKIFANDSELGGYPLLNPAWTQQNVDKETALGRVLYDYSEALLIQSYVYLDAKNTKQHILNMDQASLGLLRINFVESDTYKKIIDAYKALQASTAKTLAEYLKISNLDNTILEKDLKAMFDFETAIAKIMVPEDERRNSTAMYNPTSLKDIKTSYPEIKWQVYFNQLIKDDNTIDDKETIIVVEPGYFSDLNALLKTTEPKVILNYIHWRILLQTLPNGPDKMRTHYEKFLKDAMGITKGAPREDTCARRVAAPFDGMGGLGFAVAHEYVKKNFEDASKSEVNKMVEGLRSSFKELVADSSWMDAETQEKAKEKADAMVQSLGYPDWLKDVQKLEEKYKKLKDLKPKTLLENIKNVRKFESYASFSALLSATDRTVWPLHPAVVNAVYSPMRNSITFPAGILQYPFFKSGNPMYLNFGSIGVVIGHEITHGFDDQGSQYDKDGNVLKWWSDSSLEAFKQEKKCIVDQYSNFNVPEVSPDAHVNGVLTQGENIADNGGLRESFRAYKKWVDQKKTDPRLPGLEKYTPEQMFFIAYSQTWCEIVTKTSLENQILSNPHSPGKFRSWGPVSNSKSFSKAFKCKPDDAMNNGDKSCVLW